MERSYQGKVKAYNIRYEIRLANAASAPYRRYVRHKQKEKKGEQRQLG